MKPRFTGLNIAMVTPFAKDGAVDYDKVGPLAETLAARGANGLFLCGTTGEAPLLDRGERERILEIAIEAAGKKCTIIAHTGSHNTREAAALTEHAAASGAHAISAVTPGYYRYDDDALLTFYKTVGKAAGTLPLFLYHIPGCAINGLSLDFILRAMDAIPNLAGIKDSSGDMQRLTRLVNALPKEFLVVNGCDHFGYQAMCIGTRGAVSGTGNAVPELYRAVFDHFEKGRHAEARAAQLRLEAACQALTYGGMLSAFKETMRLRGIFDPGRVRPPQRELTPAEKKALAAKWRKLGLL